MQQRQSLLSVHNSGQEMRVEVPYLMYMITTVFVLPRVPSPLPQQNHHTCLMTCVSFVFKLWIATSETCHA